MLSRLLDRLAAYLFGPVAPPPDQDALDAYIDATVARYEVGSAG